MHAAVNLSLAIHFTSACHDKLLVVFLLLIQPTFALQSSAHGLNVCLSNPNNKVRSKLYGVAVQYLKYASLGSAGLLIVGIAGRVFNRRSQQEQGSVLLLFTMFLYSYVYLLFTLPTSPHV